MLDQILNIIKSSFETTFLSLSWVNVIEIFVIAVTLLLVYRRFIRNTQSEKLVKGLFFLALAWIIAQVLIYLNIKIIGGLWAIIKITKERKASLVKI